MAEAKATKREILDFMEDQEVITPRDLAERFEYTYSYACKKLSLLKRQGLAWDLGNTPSSYRGQWCLTDKGYARLAYLSRKLGVLTQKRKREWREWFQRERQKPFEQQRIWWVGAYRPRMVNVGERGVTLSEAIEAVKTNSRFTVGYSPRATH